MPSPPWERLSVRSFCTKSSKILGNNCAGIPAPLSKDRHRGLQPRVVRQHSCEQVGDAADGGQRAPQLVGQRREELVLEAICLAQSFLAFLQGFESSLALDREPNVPRDHET